MDNGAVPYMFKIALIGDAGVGKSNLLLRFTKDEFNSGKAPTIGVEMAVKSIPVGSDIAKLQVWDTAGQERFKATSQQYYRNAAGIVMVYDITKKKTLLNLEKWLEEVRNYASPEVTLVVVGNKKDLDEVREVPAEEGQAFAEANKGYFLETSALENSDKMIEKVFFTLSEDLIAKKKDDDDIVEPTGTKILNQDKSAPAEEKKSGCC